MKKAFTGGSVQIGNPPTTVPVVGGFVMDKDRPVTAPAYTDSGSVSGVWSNGADSVGFVEAMLPETVTVHFTDDREPLVLTKEHALYWEILGSLEIVEE